MKDIISGLNILVGKYQNRNLLSRIWNKPLELDEKETAFLDVDKKELLKIKYIIHNTFRTFTL